jgi:hypothetical protein
MNELSSPDEQILTIVKEGEAERKVADLCRTHRMTEQTYYRRARTCRIVRLSTVTG